MNEKKSRCSLHPLIVDVIKDGKATLRELRENYSLHDLFNIWEIVYDTKLAIWNRNEQIRREREMRR